MPSPFYRSRSPRQQQPTVDDRPLVQAYQQEAQATDSNDAQAMQMDVIRQEQQKDAAAARQMRDNQVQAAKVQAITVKTAKAQGVETQVDPITAKETITTRPDGSPVWQPGFTGAPRPADNGHVVDYRDPTGQTFTVPLAQIRRKDEPTGAMYEFDVPGADGKPQTIRRAEETGKPLFKVDKATGQRFAEAVDPVTGGLVQQPLGMDPVAANAAAIEQRKTKWEAEKANRSFAADELRLQQQVIEQQNAPARERLAELERKAKDFETGIRYEETPNGIVRFRNSSDDMPMPPQDETEIVKAKAFLENRRITQAELAKLAAEQEPITKQLQEMELKRRETALSLLRDEHATRLEVAALEDAAKKGAQVWEPESQRRIAQAVRSPEYTRVQVEAQAEGTALADDITAATRNPAMDSIASAMGSLAGATNEGVGADVEGSALQSTPGELRLAAVLGSAPSAKGGVIDSTKALGIAKPEEFDLRPGERPALIHRGTGEELGFVDAKAGRLVLTPAAIYQTEAGRRIARDASAESAPVFVLSGGAPFTPRQRGEFLTAATQAAMANDAAALSAAGADLPGIRRAVKEGKISIQDGKWIAKTIHGVEEPDLTPEGANAELSRFVAASKIEQGMWQGPNATAETRAQVVDRFMDSAAQKAQGSIFYDGTALEDMRAKLKAQHSKKGMIAATADYIGDTAKMLVGSMAGLYAGIRGSVMDTVAGAAYNLSELDAAFSGQRPFGPSSAPDSSSRLVADNTSEWFTSAAGLARRSLAAPEMQSALSGVRNWAASADPGDQPPADVVSKLAQAAFTKFHGLSDDADAKARATSAETFDITKDPTLAKHFARYLETRNPADFAALAQLVTLDAKSREIADRVNAYVTRPRAATVADVKDRAAVVLPEITDMQAKILFDASAKPGKAAQARVAAALNLSPEDAALALDLFTGQAAIDQTSLHGYFRSGLQAPIQEAATEAASTALSFGLGKLAARGFVQAAKGATVATTRRAALASWTAAKTASLVDDFAKLGMFSAKLGQPLGRMARVSNAVVSGAKAVTGDMVGEGLEEGVMGAGEAGSTLGSVFKAAGAGAMAAPVMVGGMTLLALPMEIRADKRIARDWETHKTNYLAEVNKRLEAIPGTAPFTPDEFEMALSLYDSNAARADAAAVQAAFDAAAAAGPPTPAGLQPVVEAIATAKAREAVAINAAIELREVAEEQRTLFVAATKAAMGVREFTQPELRALMALGGASRVQFTPAPGAVGVNPNGAIDLPGNRQALTQGTIPVVPPELLAQAAQASPALGELLGMAPQPTAPQVSPAPVAGATTPVSPTPAANGTAKGSGTSGNAPATPAQGGVGPAQGAPTATPAGGAPAIPPFKAAPKANITTLPDGRVEVKWTGKADAAGVIMEAKARGFEVSSRKTVTQGKTSETTILLRPPATPAPRPPLKNKGSNAQPNAQEGLSGETPKPKANTQGVESIARQVVAQITAKSPKLAKIVIEAKKAPGYETGGMWMRDDGTVAYHLPTLAAQLGGFTPQQIGQRIEALLDEEIRHAAHMEAAKRLWKKPGTNPLRLPFEQWRDAWYENIWDAEFSVEMRSTVESAYGDTMAAQPKWVKAMEGLRMLDQLRATNSITEAVLAHLESVLEFLRDALTKATPAIQREIDAIQAILVEFGYEQGAVKLEKAKTKPATAKKKAKVEAPEAAPESALSNPDMSTGAVDGTKPLWQGRSRSGQPMTIIRRTPAGEYEVKIGPDQSTMSEARTAAASGMTKTEIQARVAEFERNRNARVRSDLDSPKVNVGDTISDSRGSMGTVIGFDGDTPIMGMEGENEGDVVPENAVGGWMLESKAPEVADGWVAFPAEMGGLAVPRSSMPQIATKDRGAMVQFLKGRGITHSQEDVLPGSLKPSQVEYSPAKVAKAKTFEGPNRSILISADDHVVDGHHQWMAAMEASPNEPYPVIRLNAPIQQLLIEIARFPSAGVSDASATVSNDTKPTQEAAPEPSGFDAYNDQAVKRALAEVKPATQPAEPTREEWQKTYAKFKRALAKAVKANDYAEIIRQADAFQKHYEADGTGPFPDSWSDWERHKSEAETQLAMQGKTSNPFVVPILKPVTPARPAARPDDTYAKAQEATRAALGGLFSAPVRRAIPQLEVPRERFDAIRTAAEAIIEANIRTPEDFARFMDDTFPGGRARPYSEAIWDMLGIVDKSLRGSHDWSAIYGDIEQPLPQVVEPVVDDQAQEGQTTSDETQPGIRDGDQAPISPDRGGQPRETAQSGQQQPDSDLGVGVSDNAPSAGGGRNPGRVRKRTQRDGAGASVVDAGGREGESRPSEGGNDSVLPGSGSGVVEPEHTPSRSNYWLADPESIVGGGPKARFARNRKALETLEALQEENRDPTPAELETLAAYTGWGAFGQELFKGTHEKSFPAQGWEDESEWLKGRLGKADWESAQESILNAHYTDPPTVAAMWDMIRRMGFTGGRVLEPALGTGNFFSLMPRDLMASSQLSGIELDPTTAAIAKFLHPQANIRQMGYEESTTADSFYDLIVGNWPFKKGGPADRRYNHLNASLHDYFFVKAIDQVRPGGLVVGITSAGTMDKKSKAVRSYLASRGELVASFRLPTGAFGKYAGTAVVTDIVILKKRETPLQDISGETWVESVKDDRDRDFFINAYYQTPQGRSNILGNLDFGSGSTYGRPSMIVKLTPDFEQVLPAVAQRLPENVMQPWKPGEKKVAYIANTTSFKRQNAIVVQGDELYQVNGENLGVLQDIRAWKTKDQAKRLSDAKSLLNLRSLLDGLMDAYRTGEDTTKQREALLAAYTAHIKANGSLHKSAMLKLFGRAGDPTAADILNMEEMTATGPRPRAILTQDIMRKRALDAKGSIADAYALARNNSLDFRLADVAEAASVSEAEAEAFLIEQGQIYRTPQGVWEPADVYLAGNVRQKLREAQAAQNEGVTEMGRNITALEAIQPAETPYFEIEVQMGASWIPISDYQDFIATILQAVPEHVEIVKGSTGYNVKLTKTAADSSLARSQWGTEYVNPSNMFTAAMNSTALKVYSEPDKDGVRTLLTEQTDIANQKRDEIREQLVTWLWSDPNRTARLGREYNEAMNAVVTPRRDGSHLRLEGLALTLGRGEFDFRQHQRDAVWRFLLDGKGVGAHEVGTGKTFTIAGLAMEGRRLGVLRKPMILAHNANSSAIAADITRAYPSSKVLYLDDLGPQARENAMRQIKLDDWDAVVVPHSLITRFALKRETMLRLIQPQIDQLENEFIAALEDLPDAPDDINFDDDYGDIVKKLARVKGGHTAKELMKRKKTILEDIEKRAMTSSKEDAISFEDLGIDAVIVDEAHIFKKIPLATRKNFKGLQKEMSGAGFQLQLMTDYLKSINNGKGVFLFTGTPVTNTLNEVFNMMRFVMSDEFTDAQIANFDDWFNSFAQATTDIELTSGGTFEPIERVLSFINIPELARMAGRVFDVVRANDMPEFKPRASDDGLTDDPVGRPRKLTIPVVAAMSPDQRQHKRNLEARYREYQKLDGKGKMERKKKGGDIPVKIETDGRKSALDHRLFDAGADDFAGSKINLMVGNIMEHFREHPKSSQMVFQEVGVNDFVDREKAVRDADGKPALNADGKPIKTKERVATYNLLRDMVEKLVAQGVKPEEIAIFHNMSLDPIAERSNDVLRKVRRVSAATPKEELAAMMNRGEIRVAFGSTQTMGTGVNAQDWLRAMHHLDAPWTPGEFEQRNGRGWRQGNRWNTVMEYRYFTEESHDGKMWQTLLNKVRFIERFTSMLQGKGTMSRVLEGEGADTSEDGSVSDFEQSFSSAAGDPRLLVRAKLEKEVQKLQRRRQVFINSISTSRDKIRDIDQWQSRDAANLPKFEQDYAAFLSAKEPFSFTLFKGKSGRDLVEGLADLQKKGASPAEVEKFQRGEVVFTERKDATDALERLPRYTTRQRIGEFGPFAIYAESTFAGTKFEAAGPSGYTYYFEKPSMQSLEATLGFLKRRANSLSEDMAKRAQERASLNESLTKPWSRESELTAKEKALEQIQLEITASPTPAPAWLRHGAPTGSLVYVRNESGGLDALDVAAHRWDANDYWILVDNGTDLVPIRYSEALTETGSRLFQDYEFQTPGVAPTPPAGTVDVIPNDAWLNMIDREEGRGLASAPAPRRDDAKLKDALQKMPEIWRKVLEAKMRGDAIPDIATANSISEVAVGNVLRVAEGRLRTLLAQASAIKPTVRVEGDAVKAASGRPDLSMSGNAPFIAVDQQRTIQEVTHAEMNELAGQMFAEAPEAAEAFVVRWMDSGTTNMRTDDQPPAIQRAVAEAQARSADQMLMTAAAKLLVTDRSMKGGDAVQTARLIDLYRNTGTELARALGMRQDPFLSPEERAAMYITEALLTPPESMRNDMRRNPSNKENILKEWAQKSDQLKADLKAAGMDIDATFAALRREKEAAERAIPVEIKTPLARANTRTQKLVRSVLEGKTWREAADAAKMTLEQARKAYNAFRAQVNETGAQAAQAARDALLRSAPAPGADFAAQIGLPEWTEEASPDTAPVKTETTEALKKERTRKKSAGEIDLKNPVDVARVETRLSTFKSSTFDKFSEFWRASILSGPQTQVVNISSGLAFGIYETAFKKLGTAALADAARLFGMKPDAASLADIPAMVAATKPAIAAAFRDSLRAWKAETSFFDAYAKDHRDESGMFKGESFNPSLKGPVGTVMRSISFRLMLLADEFVKSFFTRIEVAAKAREIARSEGLKGEAMANRIAELLTPGSIAWVRALDNSLKITFQTPLKTNNGIVNQVDHWAAAIQNMKKGKYGWLLKGVTHFVFPFVSTPTNIFKMGVQMSPLGTFTALIDAGRSLNESRKGNTEEAARLYNAARLFDDMVNQIVAWGVLMAVSDLVMPGDDEDELPFITGTMSWKATREGERQLAYRTAPPMSIRIGGRWWSYGRLDPFATSLAFVVDTVKEFNKGAPLDETWGKIAVQMLTTVQDKTFLQGFSDLVNAFEQPERFGTRWATNIVTGFVPNLIRQPIRSADENIREDDLPNDMGFMEAMRTRVGYSIVPQTAPPAIDVWGRPEVKGTNTGSPQTDFMLRLFSPAQSRGLGPDPLDVAILRYNLTADKPIAITAPDRELRRTAGKQVIKASLTDDEWGQLASAAGRTARMMIGQRFNGRNLTDDDAEFIRDVVKRAHDVHRETWKRKKLVVSSSTP